MKKEFHIFLTSCLIRNDNYFTGIKLKLLMSSITLQKWRVKKECSQSDQEEATPTPQQTGSGRLVPGGRETQGGGDWP